MMSNSISVLFSEKFLIIIYGLLVGSFLNVVIYRVPRDESIVLPGSHCPLCGSRLRPWDMVPVISYFLLRGKCRECGAKISRTYPLVEILTGCLFLYLSIRLERSSVSELCIGYIFIALLIALSFIDIKTMRLPDSLVMILFFLGLTKMIMTNTTTFLTAVEGALAAAGCFFLIYLFYDKGIGLGDVKLTGALGFFLGFPDIIFAVLLGSLMGSIAGFILILIGRIGIRQPIPFGPFLAAGAIFMYIEKSYFELFF